MKHRQHKFQKSLNHFGAITCEVDRRSRFFPRYQGRQFRHNCCAAGMLPRALLLRLTNPPPYPTRATAHAKECHFPNFFGLKWPPGASASCVFLKECFANRLWKAQRAPRALGLQKLGKHSKMFSQRPKSTPHDPNGSK